MRVILKHLRFRVQSPTIISKLVAVREVRQTSAHCSVRLFLVIDRTHLLSMLRLLWESSLLSALYGVSSYAHLYGFTRAQRIKFMFRMDFQLNIGVRVFDCVGFTIRIFLAQFLFSLYKHRNAELFFSFDSERQSPNREEKNARARKMECVNGINLYRLCLGFIFCVAY